jgi:hypothetical protein
LSRNEEYRHDKWGSIVLGVLAAAPFAAVGSFLFFAASIWEITVFGARNGTAIGDCDFVGSSVLIVGIGLIGLSLLWTAGLILRSVGWDRPASSPTWANVIMLFLLAVGMTLYGIFFGEGCAILN